MSGAIQPARPSALAPSGERWTWLSLLQQASRAQLELALLGGTQPSFESLIGWEFGGGNCVALYRLLGIRKFVKGFYQGPPRTAEGPAPFIQGYNIPAEGNADEAEHRCQPSEDAPKRFGFYRVHDPVEGARDAFYPNALLLDYGLGGNGLFGPPLRDYVVQVYPDDPDLLLGKAYAAVGPIRIPLNFFVLKRRRQATFAG